MARRRHRNTGSLRERNGNWYGRWRIGDEQVERKLGRVRQPGSRDGMTESQAHAELQRRMGNERIAPSEAVSVRDAGESFLTRLGNLDRSPGHIEAVTGHLKNHVYPYAGFERKTADKITRDDIEQFIAHLRGKESRGKPLSPKTIRNIVSSTHSVFEHARRKGWAETNPVEFADLPAADPYDDTRFYTLEEVMQVVRVGLTAETVARNQRDRDLDAALRLLERPLYLLAASTGMRMGELRALRWRDIDWSAGRVRIVKNLTRGKTKTPKGKKGRTLPVTRAVLGELDRWSKLSHYAADDDRVFAHPHKGTALDRALILKRWQRAAGRAGVRVGAFHELRHTFGTALAPEASSRALREWGGWEDDKTAKRYQGWSATTDEAAPFERAFADFAKLGD